jgi:hypothetical protein
VILTIKFCSGAYSFHRLKIQVAAQKRAIIKPIKVKVKLSLWFFLTEHRAMKAYWGSAGTAPLIL